MVASLKVVVVVASVGGLLVPFLLVVVGGAVVVAPDNESSVSDAPDSRSVSALPFALCLSFEFKILFLMSEKGLNPSPVSTAPKASPVFLSMESGSGTGSGVDPRFRTSSNVGGLSDAEDASTSTSASEPSSTLSVFSISVVRLATVVDVESRDADDDGVVVENRTHHPRRLVVVPPPPPTSKDAIPSDADDDADADADPDADADADADADSEDRDEAEADAEDPSKMILTT